MTRSTLSRRARNSASVMIVRRRPASRPSRRRCFLASRRVEPLTAVGSSRCERGSRTRVTVPGGSSPSPSPDPAPRRRRRRRRLVPLSPSSPCSSGPVPPASSALAGGRRMPCRSGRRRPGCGHAGRGPRDGGGCASRPRPRRWRGRRTRGRRRRRLAPSEVSAASSASRPRQGRRPGRERPARSDRRGCDVRCAPRGPARARWSRRRPRPWARRRAPPRRPARPGPGRVRWPGGGAGRPARGPGRAGRSSARPGSPRRWSRPRLGDDLGLEAPRDLDRDLVGRGRRRVHGLLGALGGGLARSWRPWRAPSWPPACGWPSSAGRLGGSASAAEASSAAATAPASGSAAGAAAFLVARRRLGFSAGPPR